jgi:ADP-ribose pyrophosphatase YjhB (NUDIX family)
MPDGSGPFLWLTEHGPRAGFQRLPEGGLCLSTFLFVRRGELLLLGKYAPDPAAWERLTGLDPGRVERHRHGWTLPASHLKYGEDPRAAARRVAEDVLLLKGLRLAEPRVETEYAVWERPSGGGAHFDVWFFVDAEGAPEHVATPPWYAALAWKDPRALRAEEWGRQHQDVWAHWDAMR